MIINDAMTEKPNRNLQSRTIDISDLCGTYSISEMPKLLNNLDKRMKEFEKLIQQPTEIEVAVEMEKIPDGLDENCHIQYAKVPKLDSEGNLILKKL